jgi:diketogulonate reductase-like aldo/keto reductase
VGKIIFPTVFLKELFMRHVTLPDGETVPALGQGTWYMGERRDQRTAEVKALRHGLDLGMTLIDTAEMYGEGGAEEVVGEAVAGRRDDVFIVSKVYPHNASTAGVPAACARSLKRLGTDRIDLYLLHWRGSYPLAETVAALERLKEAGHIRHWGVSNFDTDDMAELWRVTNGRNCATDQVLLNLSRRGPEYDLLPWCGERVVPVMAYSPIEQGRLPRGGAVDEVAGRHGVDRFTVALAWLLAKPGVIAIPKAARLEHVTANRHALDLALTEDDHRALDRACPPPTRKQPLAML